MKYKEHLSWILDKGDHYDEEKVKENIDFVHSLGKKCDSVGWSELDMDEPGAEEVLDKIQAFCKERGFSARCYYERSYTGVKSDWYELKVDPFKDNTVLEYCPVETQTGERLSLGTISAYHEISISPKGYIYVCVPDRFRKACIKSGITDVDFCWMKDKGRYEAEQYFYFFPHKQIPHIIYDKNIDGKQKLRLKKLGGNLPKIASVFHTLQYIGLQDCYLKEDMPSGGIACVYCPQTMNFCGRFTVLIHKDTAEMLINEKALSWANLTPACVVDECPEGYDIDETEEIPTPLEEYIEKGYEEYEKLKAKVRPKYIVKEKDALKFLRKTKSERKFDFNKKMSKKQAEEISDSLYALLLPYYQVCDGGILSDEYTFLSYAESLKATKGHCVELEKEELLEAKYEGVVIATCADGDSVLLTKDEKVIRFSHEAPENIGEWQSIAAFFVEAINDAE